MEGSKSIFLPKSEFATWIIDRHLFYEDDLLLSHAYRKYPRSNRMIHCPREYPRKGFNFIFILLVNIYEIISRKEITVIIPVRMIL